MVRTSVFISSNKIVINVCVLSDSVQTTQNPPASPTVSSSAVSTNTAPSSKKGKGRSNQHGAHGMRSDTGGSSSKFQTSLTSQTNAHSSASRTNTAPPSRKRHDYSTQHTHSAPPPLPPKPEEFRPENFHTGPPPTGGNPNLNHGESYPRTTPPPIKKGTGQTGYPSPGPSPPRDQRFYQSPPGSPEVLNQWYPPSQGSTPFPQTPHHQTLSFRAGAPQTEYPSPGPSPPGHDEQYYPPPGGTGHMKAGYPPQGK